MLLSFDKFITLGIEVTKHGSQMLEALMAAGEIPLAGIISTDNKELLEISRLHADAWPCFSKKIAKCSEKFDCVNSVAQYYRKAEIPFVYVSSLSSEETCSLLRKSSAPAALLAEGPILRGEVIHALPCGIINFHAAPLPAFRGNYATWWALYHDVPLYVSAHIVDKGTDTGDIIKRKRLPVFHGDTLEIIDQRGFQVAGELAVELVREARLGLNPTPQRIWEGDTYRGAIPEDVAIELRHRLKNEEYSFYEPEA